MAVMTISPTALPFGRPLTADDLEQIPDDGHRYELLDGALLVSPAPGWQHQEVVMELVGRLRRACPSKQRALAAPFAVRLTPDTELQPDILVARYEDLTPKNLPVAPLLVVEVRSPSTALIDLNLKKAVYEKYGVPSYWVVDPDADVPSLRAFELDDEGRYVQVAKVSGSDVFTAERPFPFTVTPDELAAGLHPDGAKD
jgi:Uma2 family endonuclease